MLTSGKTLFAFVDLKDPFMPSEIAGEGKPGPILSILATREFRALDLFFTPHTRQHMEATKSEVERRHPRCRVRMHEIQVSDPKDYSALMGRLAREVQTLMRGSDAQENFICVSSGTAEMRTAWFILTATGLLPATMLQIGSPADPLFGAANVMEVNLQTSDWQHLRDLIMPIEYFDQFRRLELESGAVLAKSEPAIDEALESRTQDVAFSRVRLSRSRMPEGLAGVGAEAPQYPLPEESSLGDALNELGIFIGSAVMQQAAETAAIAASADHVPILLTGETGTGKEVFARLIHRLSARRDKDMVCINCAAIPKELIESHLFGHVKGAFTGATTNRIGKFEHAHGKILFLDEIGELTQEAQVKLLRVLEEREVEPLGSNNPKKVDVRIVAATNRNLPKDIAEGRFREDLFYRLNVVNIEILPLRKRSAEIPHLAAALLKQINQRYEHSRSLTKEALLRLVRHRWPGNVRELFNLLQSCAVFSRNGIIDVEDIEKQLNPVQLDPFDFLPDPSPGFDMKEFVADVKKRLVQRAVEISGGNQTAAAGLLGMTKQAVSQILNADDNAN